MSECEKFNELFDIYYKFKTELDSNPKPCCIDECCEGTGDCGDDDCCNEDGNKPMGTCWCRDEHYEPPSKELLKNFEDTDKKLTEHRDKSGCEICIKKVKEKLI